MTDLYNTGAGEFLVMVLFVAYMLLNESGEERKINRSWKDLHDTKKLR